MKKRLLALILIIILALAAATPAFAVVAKSKEYYVADYANVLSDSMKQKIISSNAGLEQKCQGAQIVVVTVKYLDGMYSDEYAMKLFNDWGVGSKTANNGMLLLLATGENKAWLTVGAGITGSFTDKMVNTYFDRYFWSSFDKGQYETAVSNMLEALFTWYAGYYGVNNGNASGNSGNNGNYNGGYSNGNTGGNNYNYNNGYNSGNGASGLGGLFVWLLVILIIIIVLVSAVATDRRRFRTYYTTMGMPIPTYYPWFIWYGPHRSWWYGPGGPGWRGGPRGPGGFGGGPGPGGGGFGGFGGRGGGSGSGGGGIGGGGGGRSGRGGGGFGGFGGFGGGGGGFGGFGGGGGGGFGGGGGGFGGGGGGRR